MGQVVIDDDADFEPGEEISWNENEKESHRISNRQKPKVSYIDLDKPQNNEVKRKAPTKRKQTNTNSNPPKRKKANESKNSNNNSNENNAEQQNASNEERPLSLDFVVEVMSTQDDPFNIDLAQSNIASIMAEAVDGEGEGANVKFEKMRAAFKVGLELEQEETKGISRFKAITEGSYKIQKSNTHSLQARERPLMTDIL
jgi:hypothetical protein